MTVADPNCGHPRCEPTPSDDGEPDTQRCVRCGALLPLIGKGADAVAAVRKRLHRRDR